MSDEETVGYYYHRKKQEVVLVFRLNQWAARNLLAKGFTFERHFLTRLMTEYEKSELESAKRLMFRRYTNWEGLFEDETAVGVPAAIIEQLRQFSKNRPLSNKTQNAYLPEDACA